jgi:hypothetical protein
METKQCAQCSLHNDEVNFFKFSLLISRGCSKNIQRAKLNNPQARYAHFLAKTHHGLPLHVPNPLRDLISLNRKKAESESQKPPDYHQFRRSPHSTDMTFAAALSRAQTG